MCSHVAGDFFHLRRIDLKKHYWMVTLGLFTACSQLPVKSQPSSEPLYLEIAPQTKPCVAGVMQTQCLQVKKVSYNALGKKQTLDENWLNFYSPIEGYQHNNHEQVVIQMKQIQIKNPPMDSAHIRYVFERYVERKSIN